MKVSQAQKSPLPCRGMKGEFGKTGGGKWGEWKTGNGAGKTGIDCQMNHWSHTTTPLVTLRHLIRPASTNKHGMHYIKEPQISKAPRSFWKGMWHVKWHLLLMQTSGLRFLAAVTQASPWGPTAGLDRTTVQEVTFRNTFTAQLPL